jgi:hypothetical protein
MNPLSRPSRVTAALHGLVLSVALAAGAAHCAAPEAAFQSAYETFSRAQAGDESAIEASANAFETLLRAEPGNPVLQAYAGASTAMKAGTTMLPWKKMGHAEDGMAQLDKALALLKPADDGPIQHNTPGSLEVRFIAASTFLAVPPFMNRGARGTKLLNDVMASPLFAASPLGFRGEVWMRAGRLAAKDKRLDDARRHFNEVIAQGAPQAAAARQDLQGLAK